MEEKDLVNLWHESQMGNIHKCREKHLEFTGVMWKLYYKHNLGMEEEGIL